MTNEDKQNMIYSFRNENYFLSNFYKCEFQYNSIWYNSAEAAYQASKTLDFTEKNRIALMQQNIAKRAGRKVELRDDFDGIKKNIMTAIIVCKFMQNEWLLERLLDTYDKKLIEGNYWHDNYWGVCNCGGKNCNGGKNMLGKILMTVRRTAMEDIDKLKVLNEKYRNLYDD